jgi:hypothetical protein
MTRQPPATIDPLVTVRGAAYCECSADHGDEHDLSALVDVFSPGS